MIYGAKLIEPQAKALVKNMGKMMNLITGAVCGTPLAEGRFAF